VKFQDEGHEAPEDRLSFSLFIRYPKTQGPSTPAGMNRFSLLNVEV
jgi:hypothetical protein